MRGNDSDRTVFAVAQPCAGYRRVAWVASVKTAAAERVGRPKPAERGIEEPAAVVIRRPTPGLIADERHSDRRIVEPVAAVERRPAETDAVGTPAVSKLARIEGEIGRAHV